MIFSSSSIPEAGTMLSDFWIRMSEQGLASNRSFDSLIRIARGQARLHLKEEIDAPIASEINAAIMRLYVYGPSYFNRYLSSSIIITATTTATRKKKRERE